MAHDVFISYSSRDRAVGNAVCAALERGKIRCWIAPRDVLPGIPYGEALVDAISECKIMVLVFSSGANSSPQVMREVERAVAKDIPIVPFRIEDVTPSKAMEFYISAHHWLDALTPPLEDHLQRLSETVSALLSRIGSDDAARTPLSRPGTLSSRTTPEPLGQEFVLTLSPGVEMEFVRISPGAFLMGSPTTERWRENDEGPQHEVTLTKGFWLGKYPVIQTQWQTVMGANPSYFSGYRLPVESVTWDACQEFVQAVNGLGQGRFRLPTEAEWEYACRAGSQTAYCFGDDPAHLDEYAWHRGNSPEITHPVGLKKPNSWGLYDIHGNVWEWCQDWYHESFEGAHADGAAWETPPGRHRVLRGGSWGNRHGSCRAARRYHGLPRRESAIVGLGLLRSQE